MHRRALLKRAAGVGTLAGLAGCSQFKSQNTSPTTTEPADDVIKRVLLRADTDVEETVDLTLMSVDSDGQKARRLWGNYTAPESDDPVAIEDFDGPPGVYSLTAHSREYNTVETQFEQTTAYEEPLQFEVVVQRHGAIWANLGPVADTITIPGYSPDKIEP